MAAEALPQNPDLATARTIEVMARYIREDAQAPLVRQAAMAAIWACPEDAYAKAEAIFWWVKSRVRFVSDADSAAAIEPAPADPLSAELLIRPVDLLQMKPAAGDCDDFAMLTAALLESAGIRTRLVTIAADPLNPRQFTHVYVYALMPHGKKLALDTSHGAYVGWEHAYQPRREEWTIETPMQKLSGLNGWVDDIVKLTETGTTAAVKLLNTRTGTFIQDKGGTYYRQPAGASAATFPGVGVNVGLQGQGTLLLIVGAVALLLVITSRR